MLLIVGLGNYTPQYAQTRHNFGFLAVDQMAQKFHFSEWKEDKKFFGAIATGQIKSQKVILLKPHTFMNLSGKSVLALKNYYKLDTSHIFLLSDDVDQEFGSCRFREKGSDGGQRGLRDIFNRLGSNDIKRIKFGIKNEFKAHTATEDFVLSRFTKEEYEQLPAIIETGTQKLLENI